MLSLNAVETGRDCIVVWMLGSLGRMLKEYCRFEEDDHLHMIRNLKQDGVIVSVDGRRYAMSRDCANVVKVDVTM